MSPVIHHYLRKSYLEKEEDVDDDSGTDQDRDDRSKNSSENNDSYCDGDLRRYPT